MHGMSLEAVSLVAFTIQSSLPQERDPMDPQYQLHDALDASSNIHLQCSQNEKQQSRSFDPVPLLLAEKGVVI